VNPWDEVLAKVETKVNRHSFATWFRPTQFLRQDGRSLLVRVPNPQFKEWLAKNYHGVIVEALSEVQALLGGGEAGWSIRTFRAGDLAAIASRQSILYEAYGWGLPMEILQGEVTTSFLRDFKLAREQCWVAEQGGRMAGAVLLVDAGGDVGQLRLLHVEPWARGLGIGRALVAECVAFARAAGYARIRLWTHTVLESARRIYQAAGFEIVETAIHDGFGKPEQGETWELALR